MREIYDKMESHKNTYTIDINNVEIDIFPYVYSPHYYNDSAYFAKVIPRIVGKKKFLEIGSGTGIIALCVALNGAEVSVTDINQDAIKNTEHNFKKHSLNPKVYCGDIYEPLPLGEKFDFIFWSHPFNKGDNPDESYLLQSGFDFQYESIKKYIQQAHLHLTKNGRLLLGTGKFALLSKIRDIATKQGYEMKLLERVDIPVSKYATNFENDFRIYEFVKNG